MTIIRDKEAEREGMTEPFEDYLMIECDLKTRRFGVRFSRNNISRESAIRQYRKILKALMEIEEEDIAEGRT